MIDFNYEKFTEDIVLVTDTIKEIILKNTEQINNLKIDVSSTEENHKNDFDVMSNVQNNIEKSCLCLANLYLTVSKVYENLNKIQTPMDKTKIADKSKIATRYDKLFE